MAASTIACPNCGRRNRVPAVARGVPRCAVCHHNLPWIVDSDEATFDGAVDATVPVLVDFWATGSGRAAWSSPIVERIGRD